MSILLEFVKIPAGKFLMGSSEQDEDAHAWEKPQFEFLRPYDYYISRFLVTNSQFNAFEIITEEAILTRTKGKGFRDKAMDPVVNITWHHAQGFVRWLNKIYGTELPPGYIYRLPSEPEWEKAARGSDGQKYSWGNSMLSCVILEKAYMVKQPV